VTILYLDSCIRCSPDVLFTPCTVAVSNSRTRLFVCLTRMGAYQWKADKRNVGVDRLDIFSLGWEGRGPRGDE
jgi:hypothetical protein